MVLAHERRRGFEAELGALAPLGRIVVFGNAARHPNDVATNYLLQTSKPVIGFWLVPLIARRRELLGVDDRRPARRRRVGELEVVIGDVYSAQ